MKKLVILLAAALTFNSCSDSFLDLSNPSALSPSVYPKSMADMETIVTSVYACMEKGLWRKGHSVWIIR